MTDAFPVNVPLFLGGVGAEQGMLGRKGVKLHHRKKKLKPKNKKKIENSCFFHVPTLLKNHKTSSTKRLNNCTRVKRRKTWSPGIMQA